MIKIKGTCKGQMDDKRFKVPGVIVEDECPKCGAAWKADLGKDHYLCYPIVGKPYDLNGYCHKCQAEWSVRVILRVSLEVAPC